MKRILMTALAALLMAGCFGGDYDGLSIQDPWARPSPEVATTAAFFFTIANDSEIAETLVGAATDACRVTEIHLSSMNDGVMTMQQLPDGLEVPAFDEVTFAPGGYHVMCIDKIATFAPDEEITLTLEFENESGNRHTESITAVVEDR